MCQGATGGFVITGDHLPVDLWVMDVEDDDAFERVKIAAADAFGEDFEWGGSLTGLPRKGVVLKIDEERAVLAASLLGHLGARMAIDEEAYAEPGLWFSSITPYENCKDTLETVEKYLDGGHGAGLLTVRDLRHGRGDGAAADAQVG